MPHDAETDDLDPTALKFVGPATAEVMETASFGPEAVARKEVSFGMLLDAGVNPGVAARIRREHSLPWSFDTEADRGDLDRRSDQIRGLGDGERAWVAASAGDWADGDADGDADATPTSEATRSDDEPAAQGEWPETARPDDADEDGQTDGPPTTDPRPPGEWPETARPDEETDEPGSLGEWPETARPDGVVPGDDAASDDAPGDDAASDDVSPETGPRTADGSTDTDDRTPATADGSGDPVQAETAWRERSAPVPVSELDGVNETVQDRLAAAGITSVRSLATADPAAVAAALDLSEETVARLRATARSFAGGA